VESSLPIESPFTTSHVCPKGTESTTYLINGWHPIWTHSRTYFSNWGVMESNYLFAVGLPWSRSVAPRGSPREHQITFQLLALAGFRLRSAR